MRAHHRALGRRIILTALAAMVGILSGASFVFAAQGDPTLQGRVLQRSDGYLFVYKDGTRYPVGVTAMSDDSIEALPLGAPIDRVDQLFAPPAGASETSGGPAGNAALPQPGTLLYQADWSNGPGGWALPADWQTSAGTVGTTRPDQVTDLVAPYQPPTTDYAVEAELQVARFGAQIGLVSQGFGLIARGDSRSEFQAGIRGAGHAAFIGSVFDSSASRTYTAGSGWHLYRFEAKGDQLRLLVDGVSWTEYQLNPILRATTPNGHVVGLWANAAQINARSFKVFAL